MSSIVTAVFKFTIGLLVQKGRDKAAEKLKDGDVTDQKFRGLIVREIDDIKSKLDGLSRKDLLASISFFEEGIELLYKVFDQARSKSGNGVVAIQAACAVAFNLTEGMRNLELNDLNESATRALSDAKKRFEDARKEATRAFNNEALQTPDRILAMQYRVMATILEKVDNPEDAVEPCRVCLKELNSLSAVKNCFQVQLRQGIQRVRALVGKDERRKIISSVYNVNLVVYYVTKTVGKDVPFLIWPKVDTGDEKVDPLCNERLAKIVRKQDMELVHWCVTPWSFGQKGEKAHKLKRPYGIATNSSGQFIVGDYGDSNVKVFDNTGKFLKILSLPNDDVDTKLYVVDVATDMNDNIYVLVELKKPGAEREECAVFNNTAHPHHKFAVLEAWGRLTVTDSGKVLVLSGPEVVDYSRPQSPFLPLSRRGLRTRNERDLGTRIVVDVYATSPVYDTDGQFVFSFGENILKNAKDITAANDGRIMVVDWVHSCVHIFNEHGDHHNKFKLQGCYSDATIAFHRASEHVVVASLEQGRCFLHVEIYTKDGEFVRSTQILEPDIVAVAGTTVTTEGRIAVVCLYDIFPPKVLVL